MSAGWLALGLLPALAFVVGGWISDALTRRQMRRYRAMTKGSTLVAADHAQKPRSVRLINRAGWVLGEAIRGRLDKAAQEAFPSEKRGSGRA